MNLGLPIPEARSACPLFQCLSSCAFSNKSPSSNSPAPETDNDQTKSEPDVSVQDRTAWCRFVDIFPRLEELLLPSTSLCLECLEMASEEMGLSPRQLILAMLLLEHR